MSIVSASTTNSTAYQVTADTTGQLVFQTGSGPTEAVRIDASGNVFDAETSTSLCNGKCVVSFSLGKKVKDSLFSG